MSYRAQENLFQLGESFFKTQMYIDTFDEKRTHYFYDEKAFEMMALLANTHAHAPPSPQIILYKTLNQNQYQVLVKEDIYFAVFLTVQPTKPRISLTLRLASHSNKGREAN